MRRPAVLIIPLALVLLAGCSGGTPAPAQTSPPPATAEPTTPPTPVKPAIGELILSGDGLGPVVIGQAPPATDPTLDVLVFSPDVCQWAVDEGSITDPGKWVANYSPALEGKSADPFGVQVTDDVVEAIAVYNDSIATEKGIHLGSTAAEVMAAYPTELELLADQEFGDTHMYRLAGVSGDLYIDVLKAESVATYPEIGGELVVRLNVTTKAGGTPPGFNSDYGLGFCVSA